MFYLKYAIITAAGLGSRLGHGIPKCMLTVGNENKTILLDRLITQLHNFVENIIVIVGYREDLIVRHCEMYHRNIILIRNPMYRETNTAYSYWLASKHLGCEKVLFIDGDVVVTTQSLEAFIRQGASCDMLIGITPTSSENPIGIVLDQGQEFDLIKGFKKKEATSMEWANTFIGLANIFDKKEKNYVFELLDDYLPQRYGILLLSEVDTLQDLEKTNAFVDENPI